MAWKKRNGASRKGNTANTNFSVFRTVDRIELLGDRRSSMPQVALEVKGKERITTKDFKGLRQFKKEYPNAGHLFVVCLDERTRRTEDGLWVMHYGEFLKRLWNNEWNLS